MPLPPFVTRHRRLLTAAALVVVAVVGVLWLTWPESVEQKVARVHPGMPRDEVATLVGPFGELFASAEDPDRPGLVDVWRLSDESLLWVWYGDACLVVDTQLDSSRTPSVWDRVRRRLPW